MDRKVREGAAVPLSVGAAASPCTTMSPESGGAAVPLFGRGQSRVSM